MISADTSLRARVCAALRDPRDIASLVYFRIAFGLLMAWECVEYMTRGRVAYHWIEPAVHFGYPGFTWVRPWPGIGMYIHFSVLAGLALLIAAGLFYRAAAILFCIGFVYVFLLEQAQYLNHFYLIALLSGLLTILPLHRAGSIDAIRRPSLRRDWAPGWCLFLVRTQLGIVYFFGGLAKLTPDWLRGEPMRTWLGRREHLIGIGPFVHHEWTAYFFSYGGLLFDLLIVPALLWRKTRIPAFVVVIAFHLTNAYIFTIGVFPWLMIAATFVFAEPDWPRRLLRLPPPRSPFPPPSPLSPALRAFLATYLLVQCVLPLRHWLYPGNVNWTEEGHRFSWRMKLRSKHGFTRFYIRNPSTGEVTRFDPLSELSMGQATDMSVIPSMVREYAHHLADRFTTPESGRPEVRAVALVHLNDREHHLLVDPARDLAAVPFSFRSADWILPLERETKAAGADPATRVTTVRYPYLKIRSDAREARLLDLLSQQRILEERVNASAAALSELTRHVELVNETLATEFELNLDATYQIDRTSGVLFEVGASGRNEAVVHSRIADPETLERLSSLVDSRAEMTRTLRELGTTGKQAADDLTACLLALYDEFAVDISKRYEYDRDTRVLSELLTVPGPTVRVLADAERLARGGG